MQKAQTMFCQMKMAQWDSNQMFKNCNKTATFIDIYVYIKLKINV